MTLKFGCKSISPVKPFLTIDEISNCILEIPQNIKLTLEDNVLTLKAGSILTKTGSTYATYTYTADKSLTISRATTDGLYIVFADATNVHSPRPLAKVSSGDSNSFPTENLDILSTYYNTDDKLIYRWNPNTLEWVTYFGYYPICLLEVKSGVASFAKDANDNNIIFNGAGFIGSTRFIYPGIKALVPDGKNADGSLKSIEYTTDSLNIYTISGETVGIYCTIGTDMDNYRPYYEQEQKPNTGGLWYNPETNLLKRSTGGGQTWAQRKATLLCYYATDSNSKIISMDIRQPVKNFYQL